MSPWWRRHKGRSEHSGADQDVRGRSVARPRDRFRVLRSGRQPTLRPPDIEPAHSRPWVRRGAG